MDAHTEEDVPPAAQKSIFSRPEERRIRRHLIWIAAALDAIAIAIIIPLCVGGWVNEGIRAGAAVYSRDVYLVTWSAAFRRSESQRESTFALTWFMSSCCFEEMYVDREYALAGCIRRMPGSVFDLQRIKSDLSQKLYEPNGYGPSEGHFEWSTNATFTGASTVGSMNALSSYGIFLAITLGTWIFQIVAKRNEVMLNAPHWRVVMAAHALALVALLVASSMITAAAHKANAAFGDYEDVFPYHAVGSSFKAMAWCAFISHLLGRLVYAASVKMWDRLQNLDLYPPEPEDEFERLRRETRGPGPYRPPRSQQAPVHREADANAVDDELPPYSRIDPNEGRLIAGEPTQPGSREEPIELTHFRDVRNPPLEDHGSNPAPAYELHEWPSSQTAPRQTS
ncbi:uncharacterized protein CTRU02_205864 [Colletotrichum truncatum]|uniref:Uncharacterized protein n=1 Tax=Colletotrichum truncatum TaxID=5467 RepID=A0ACC3Z584_COLTU|nr:uncharacterized protein CTRU02_04696 [Colletotrichum truncatum]KAF6795133.1 hypothetical protein CTRU02_04696 [Colletotrichum truncatum]